MERTIAIDRSLGVTRAAVIEDGALCEMHIEREAEVSQTESLFYGRVQAVKPSVCSVFVNVGLELNAFLPLREGVSPRPGDWLIVQGAASQSVRTKGLRVTDRPMLAGKWLVLLPGDSGVRLSKKIRDEAQRERLREAGEAVCPEGFGLIVRTASAASPDALREEAQELVSRWRMIERRAAGMTAPGLLWQREPLYRALARDLGGPELARITVNDAACYEALLDEQAAGRVDAQTEIALYDESERGMLLFDVLGLEAQIDRALRRRVWLPCGGVLAIDPCEAMTVIDVNSGKMTQGRDIEETALRVNLEAADEIARQIRLRDIGGIIVVDFIDMAREEHREQLVMRMREAAAKDRSAVRVEGMTRLDLMELTRKRKGEELRRRLCAPCGRCGGEGETLSPEETALRALRDVRRRAISGQRGPFVIECDKRCAQALAGHESPLEGVQVYGCGAHGGKAERYRVVQIGENEAPPAGAVRLGERKEA